MINTNYGNLKDSYLFATVAKKAGQFRETHPHSDLIKLSIGDVTQPLCPAVIKAMQKAVSEMGVKETFHGYGPENGYGYSFLKDAIRGYYKKKNVELNDNEVFISDGAKSDLGNILDIFSTDISVLVPDPVYPAYVDTNIMAGRTIKYINACEENGFLPLPTEADTAELIYICSPNNPTGAVYSLDQLKVWVDFALEHNSVILFDAAYEAFVEGNLPTSIYQVPGAEKCAIELCSLSKTAGFTGTRCGYTVVPEQLVRDGAAINKMWLRRQTTKYNGVPYIVQCGAAAVFTDEGLSQIKQAIAYYKNNARVIARAMDELGLPYTGGINSPYIWHKCPDGMDSWTYFDYLLNNAAVVGTPGAGFGKNGDGYFRLTAFGDAEKTAEAVQRIKDLLK